MTFWDKLSPNLITILAIALPIIGVAFTAIISNNKIKGELSKEHNELSKDNINLKSEHTHLSEKITTGNNHLTEKLIGIANTATYLRDEARDTKIRRENATNHELNAIKIQEQLAGYSEFVEHLKAENRELKISNLELRQEIVKLNDYINRIEKQQDEDMDLEP